MNTTAYPEIKPKEKIIKKLYVMVMLFVVGRAIKAAARTDRAVREEFEKLRDDFTLRLGVMPAGPAMVVAKDEKGRVQYLGSNPKGRKITLDMGIKNIEAAMLLFTFRESTAISTCRNRLIVQGDLPDACAVVRILDLVEVYLLPKIIAKLAVKRYPKWSQVSPLRKHLGRIAVYVRTLVGI